MKQDKFLVSLSEASGNPFAKHSSWIPDGLQFYPNDPADVERVIHEIESRLDAIAHELIMTQQLETLLAEAKRQVRIRLTALAKRVAAEGHCDDQ